MSLCIDLRVCIVAHKIKGSGYAASETIQCGGYVQHVSDGYELRIEHKGFMVSYYGWLWIHPSQMPFNSTALEIKTPKCYGEYTRGPVSCNTTSRALRYDLT